MLPGVQGKILDYLSDEEWHSASDVSRDVGVSPSTANKYLKEYLSTGLLIWKAVRPRRYLYKLARHSFREIPKKGSTREVRDKLVEALESAAKGRHYFDGVFAKYLYGLLDWYADVSLLQVEVAKSVFPRTSEALHSLFDCASVLPKGIGWGHINKALKRGPVVILGSDYDPKRASVENGIRVVKLEYFLADEFHENRREFAELYERARMRGVDEEKLHELIPALPEG